MPYVSRWIDGAETGLPAGKVICIGRNYAAHARELNNPIPSEPILFLKPKTALVDFEQPIILPQGQGACHHEAEIAVLISQRGHKIAPQNVPEIIGGYGVGLDLTLRDLQSRLKEKGHPWEVAKSFDGACPISTFIKDIEIEAPATLGVTLEVNGVVRQKGDVEQMLYPIHEQIAYMSGFFTLEPGDIVMTGTPAGVAALNSGDSLTLSLYHEGRSELVTQTSIA